MRNGILEYKGYHTIIEFDKDSFSLRGKIEGISDYVDFSNSDATMIEKEFHDAVDDYLEFCNQIGKEPEKEYKWTFNVRLTPELHKQLALEAFKEGESLNATIEKAVRFYLNGISKSDIQQETILILSKELETQRTYNRERDLFANQMETR